MFIVLTGGKPKGYIKEFDKVIQDLKVKNSKVGTPGRNQGTAARKEGILKSIGRSLRLQLELRRELSPRNSWLNAAVSFPRILKRSAFLG